MSIFSCDVDYFETIGYKAEKRSKAYRACKFYWQAMLSFDFADELYHVMRDYNMARRGYSRCIKRLNPLQRTALWFWKKKERTSLQKTEQRGLALMCGNNDILNLF